MARGPGPRKRSARAAPMFFFGAMSPYSWLAAERIDSLLPDAVWRGVYLWPIFKAHGRTSWGLSERRPEGMADCEKRAAERGLAPIRWPDPWPTSDLLIARAMTFADRAVSGQALLKPFALAAMRLAFREGADLAERDTVLEAGSRVGIDARALLAGISDEEVKDALRAVDDEALAAGVFGVPTVLAGGQRFWGDDRLLDAAAAA